MDHKRVIHELTQGKEFAKKLKVHLDNPSSSNELQDILIHNILSSYDKSVSLLTTHGLNPNGSTNESPFHEGMEITRFESQVSLSESPCGEDAYHEYKDPDHKDLQVDPMKSNMLQKWKNQVEVKGDMGFEEALDDGYSWRKYGQKDILGAKHPRGYYRCTHRQTEGCLATKQVQKTNEHTNIFDITYHGSHTCNRESHAASTLMSPPQNQRHLTTPSFHFPSTSNNIVNLPTLDTTSSIMSQPRVNTVEKSPRATEFESELNNIVFAATSTTSSHNVDVGFSFGEMEFGNSFNFNDSVFYD